MDFAIQIQNVSFAYKSNRPTLTNIDLNVMPGQIAGLLGPNGGGKTTLFKIISTLIRDYEGKIVINGMDPKSNLQNYLRQIGVVFQSPSLDKKLTVEENLMYQGALYGMEKRKITDRMGELLEKLSVNDRRKDLVGELSGGLSRRVEIAKSLLHSPKILIMDEPSTGLDIGVRIDLWKILSELRTSENVTVLLTTHYIEEADRCDSITLLDQGKIICSGSPSELKNKLTFKQFSVKPKDANHLQQTLQRDYQIQSESKDGYIRFQTEGLNAQEISAHLAPLVTELTYRDPSLEDVFLTHTGRGFHGERI